MFRKVIFGAVVASGLLCAAEMIPPAHAQTGYSRPTATYTYVYRVWILRHNRYTQKSWWEIYTTTNNHDRAIRVSNFLSSRGYGSYVDSVKSYY